MMKKLDGKIVGQAIRKKARIDAEALRLTGVNPKLAILRVGEEEASKSYERNAIRAMEDATIAVETFVLDEMSATEQVIQMIDELNKDESIHGVIIMQPLPEGISRQEISSELDWRKDVDGINPLNLGLLIEANQVALKPSTPQAVIEMIDYYGIDLKGKDVVVIGSSPVVGKPLSIMLGNREATVSNLHIHTEDVRKYTKQADIVISATGALGLIDETYINEGTIVFDVGYGYKDGQVMGDVQYETLQNIAAAVSPVPGGVGSVTTSVLAGQVIQAAKIQLAKKTGRKLNE